MPIIAFLANYRVILILINYKNKIASSYYEASIHQSIKVSLAAKKMKFFRAFNYIYARVGSTSVLFTAHILSADPTLWS